MNSLKNKRKIIQFSPVRSGSTLVANILRDIFPGRTVRKTHDIRSLSRKIHLHALNFPIVSTCRYPLDVIASEMKVNNVKPTIITIEKACQSVEHNGLLELKKILNRKNVLLLKYEDYYENLDFLFNHFESFFNISIDKIIREQLKNDYSIEKIQQLTIRLSSDQFINKDLVMATGNDGVFHGKHISEAKGKPGSYRTFFTEDQIKWLRYRFSDFIKDFDYNNNEIHYN